jgi:hypothetical protein
MNHSVSDTITSYRSDLPPRPIYQDILAKISYVANSSVRETIFEALVL